jgi:hypothetical protein
MMFLSLLYSIWFVFSISANSLSISATYLPPISCD